MGFFFMTTGLGGLALPALGFDLVFPLGSGLASLRDVGAAALITIFCAAMDDR